MSDDLSDPKEEYLRTTKSIETLSRLVELTSEARRRRFLQAEITRLVNYRDQLAESFELDIEDIERERDSENERAVRDEGANHYPILHSIRDRYSEHADHLGAKDAEVRNITVYTLFFEDEYFPILDKRKIDIDHLSGLDLEAFFNLFNQLKRRLEIFSTETEVIYEERGAKTLKKIKAKQVLLVEVYKFFKRVRAFCLEMLEDIDGPQKLCFNGDSEIYFTPHEQHLLLVGMTVKEAIVQIADFCSEVIEYLDIPSFNQ